MTAAAPNSRSGGWSGFWRRTQAMLIKEFIQLRRDRVSFAMIIMIPLMQLILFGYAINTTPRNLPTAVLLQEISDLGRSILKAMQNTRYFKVLYQVRRPRRSSTNCWHRARCCSAWKFRAVSNARCGAATGPRCWLPPMPPIRSPRARRSARSAADCADRAAKRARLAGDVQAAVRNPPARALQSGGRDLAQYRAGSGRHHPDHDHADLHGACRSRARSSAARWKACWRCRSRRSKSCSARSFPTSSSASCRRR